jgi:predicted nucleic acid-binding protein
MIGVLADTVIFYALLDEKDTHHQRAQLELQKIVESKTTIYLSFPIFLEAYSLLLYRLGFPSAQEFVDYCLDSVEFINPTSEDYLQAKDKALRYPDQTITLVDAITAVLSERLNLPVWSYDYHFDVMRINVWR